MFILAEGNCGSASKHISMNVYDFDKTIYRGDSTMRFILHLVRRQPRLLCYVPAFSVNALLFLAGRREKQDFKQRMLHFLALIGDVDATVDAFWRKNFCRVKSWYSGKRRPDDVVISASPEFLVRPACERLGVGCVMGSTVDRRTGVFSGPNCHGAEKVRRFREVYPDGRIDEFFSDSLSDAPLAELAQRAWLVKGEELRPWPGMETEYKEK